MDKTSRRMSFMTIPCLPAKCIQKPSKEDAFAIMKKIKRLLRFSLFLLTVFCLAFLVTGSAAIFRPAFFDSMPKMQEARRLIFLRDAVAERVHQREHYVTIDEMPDSLLDAIVAVEDSRFYSHHGFDPEAIARATLVNLQYGRIEEGASTITQQLAKNLFLSDEQSLDRKLEEALLSLDLEMHYSKDEILELYLNTIYFGSGFYGIHEASVGYFGREPHELNLPETSMLAGIPNAPSVYSPYVDFMLAKKRQIVVLDAMVRTGCISESVAESAKIKPLYFAH